MTRQITVRLPDELVEFLDRLVAKGEAGSRAGAVTQAVDRERRRQLAERDVQILSQAGPDDDLDELAKFAAHTRMDDLA